MITATTALTALTAITAMMITAAARSAGADASAPPPVPEAKRGAITFTELEKATGDGLAAEARRWYQADASRDISLDPQFLVLIDLLCRQLCTDDPLPEVERLQRIAMLLWCEGVKSPLIDLARARAAALLNSELPQVGLYRSACAGLKTANAPPALRMRAELAALARELRLDDQSGVPARARECMELMTARLAAPTTPGDRLLVAQDAAYLLSELPMDQARALASAIEGQASLDPALRRYLLGCYEVRVAWGERGSDWGWKVSDREFKRFAERLSKASEHLHAAWSADPSFCPSATKLIAVAMAGGTPEGEDPRFWFMRAIAACPDNLDAYRTLEYALLPRWRGSVEDLVALALEAARTRPKDASVGVAIEPLHILATAFDESRNDMRILRSPKVDAMVADVIKAGMERTRSARTANRLRTWKAVMGWANDRPADVDLGSGAEARPLDERVLRWLGTDARTVSDFARLHAGPIVPQVMDAEKEASASAARGAAAFKRLLETLPASTPLEVVDAVKDRLACEELTAALSEGDDWITVPTEPGLPGWRPIAGKWRANDLGRLVGSATNEFAWIELPVTPGPHFAIRVDLPPLIASPAAREGILYNFRCATEWQAFGSSVELAPIDGHIQLLRSNDADSLVTIPTPPGERGEILRLEVSVWGPWTSIRFRGEQIWVGEPPGELSDDGTKLVLGSTRPVWPGDQIVIEHVQIRRLSKVPPEIAEAMAKAGNAEPKAGTAEPKAGRP